ncbi:hypothetical protein PCE1_004631 [Barthelona sp. PCE]
MPARKKKKRSSTAKDEVDANVLDGSAMEIDIQEQYQVLEGREHVLLRPETYIGSIEPETASVFVCTSQETQTPEIELRSITYTPGLIKIFDEILVNASDHKQRCHKMNRIKVEIDIESGTISVENNGKGIPIVYHEKAGCYIPTMIFGTLLTSSNYDDSEKRVTGGRNGYGAKLANIYSTFFKIETISDGQKFVQEWTNNMSEANEPTITKNKKAEYTKITFKPDLSRFNLEELDDDHVDLMCRRCLDIAGCNDGVSVYFNGEKFPVRNFKDYVKMFRTQFTEKKTGSWYVQVEMDRWDVIVAPNPFEEVNQMSFVNSIWTTLGGTHHKNVEKKVRDKLKEAIPSVLGKARANSAVLTPTQLNSSLFIFIRCLIENPTFGSQTKETLKSKVSTFGSSFRIADEKFGKSLGRMLKDRLLMLFQRAGEKDLKKSDGRKTKKLKISIPKLEDANWAGGKKAKQCTLILTEGDSAKQLAMSGLSIIGRDKYGVFPLKGKLMNVREASAKKISDNVELNNLKVILGLKHNTTSPGTLRYGRIMIMTDQDYDGSHIKGLLINWLDVFWPRLLESKGFLQEFVTPIVRCRKRNEVISFFTVHEFEEWIEDIEDADKWDVKYYKGLATSTAKEAKEYFNNTNLHVKDFVYEKVLASQRLDLAFNPKKTDDRKHWLLNHDPSLFIDHNNDNISVQEFVDHELILFSRADNERSLPNAMDGLKQVQRKILWTMFKRNVVKDYKVAQLAGLISADSAYQHGEASVSNTIIGMAQDFPGSNNYPYLIPSGQFGTRHQGTKANPAPRYIFTRLGELTRLLFPAGDDPLLKYLKEDNQDVEPECYYPVIPTVLLNGQTGIGTGWSTNIPAYHPAQLAENIFMLMDGEEQKPMKPWYRGIKTECQLIYRQLKRSKKIKEGSWRSHGIVEKIAPTKISVTELPVGLWNEKFKETLENMMEKEASAEAKKKKKKKDEQGEASVIIEDIIENHTDNTVDYTITMKKESMALAEATDGGLEKCFGLTNNIAVSNMVLWNSNNTIQLYNTPEEIISEYYEERLQKYEERRSYLIDKLQKDLVLVEAKHRFISMIIDDELIVAKRKKQDICIDLIDEKFPCYDEKDKVITEIDPKMFRGKKWSVKRNSHVRTAFDYLLKLNILNLTEEKLDELTKQMEDMRAELVDLLNTKAKEMWRGEINAFIEAYAAWEYENSEVVTEPPSRPECSYPGGITNFRNIDGTKKIKATKTAITRVSNSKLTNRAESDINHYVSKSKFVVDSDVEDVLSEPPTPTSEKPKKSKKSKKPKVKLDDYLIDSDFSFNMNEITPTPKGRKRKVSSKTKKVQRVEEEEEEEYIDDVTPINEITPTPKGRKRKVSSKTKKVQRVEEEEEEEYIDDVTPIKEPPKLRNKRGRKKMGYDDNVFDFLTPKKEEPETPMSEVSVDFQETPVTDVSVYQETPITEDKPRRNTRKTFTDYGFLSEPEEDVYDEEESDYEL